MPRGTSLEEEEEVIGTSTSPIRRIEVARRRPSGRGEVVAVTVRAVYMSMCVCVSSCYKDDGREGGEYVSCERNRTVM